MVLAGRGLALVRWRSRVEEPGDLPLQQTGAPLTGLWSTVPRELQTWRLLYASPAPYTRERFERTYQWMMSYPDLVTTGATYESVVDNRAWE